MLDLSKIRYYASALFEVAKEENAEDKIIDNLVLVKFALKTNKELEDYFLNPDIKLEEKKESLKAVWQRLEFSAPHQSRKLSGC